VTTVLVAVGAALAVVAAVGLVLLWGRRSERAAEERMGDVVRNLNARLETMRDELGAALARTEEESRRNRFLGELAGSIDLDEVVARTLDAAAALPNVDGAVVTVEREAGPQTSATGLTEEEIACHGIRALRADSRLHAGALTYVPDRDAVEGITAGLSVPLRAETGSLGLLTIFTRDENPLLGDALAGELETLAERAGPAIENALRFRAARQQADLDALTGLHNRRYFHETLAREVARAHRYNRRLALIVLDLDDFKAINDRIGHLAGDAVLAEVAERVREVVRSSDIPCRIGGDEFGVILAESAADDADQLYARLQRAIAGRPLAVAGRLALSAGVAELRAEDDPISFFQRADEALYRAKDGGKGRVVAEPSL
jgi:diguanylate cyclase (GGDEF)-like protein